MKKILITVLILFIELLYSQNINFDTIDSGKTLYLISNLDTNTFNSLFAEKPQNSSTLLLQIGNENFASVNLLYDTKVSSLQKGDQNTFIYQDLFNPKSNPELNVTAVGNGNYIEVLGSNSISDGMTIKTTGNDKMIFVRNY